MKRFISSMAAAVILLGATCLGANAPQARVTLVEHKASSSAQADVKSSIVRKQLPGGAVQEAHVFAQEVHLGSPVTELVEVAFNVPTTLTGLQAINDFHVVSGGTCRVGQAYKTGDTCTVAVLLKPKGPGQRSGQLLFKSAGAAKPAVVGLQGLTKGAVLSFTPAQINMVPQSFINGAPLLYNPGDVTVDQGDNLYVSDIVVGQGSNSGRVYFMDSSLALTTLAGGGKNVLTPHNWTESTQVFLNEPYGLAVDSFLNLYVAEWKAGTVDLVTQWDAKLFAGTGSGNPTQCNNSTACNPLSVALEHPTGVAVDALQNVFFSDTGGYYEVPWAWGGGTLNYLRYPTDILEPAQLFGLDSTDNVYGMYAMTNTCQIGGVNPGNGFAWTALGSGTCGWTTTGGTNVRAQHVEISNFGAGYAFDAAGNMYYNDAGNMLLRRVDSYNGLVRTVAGTPGVGMYYSGDGGPATDASLASPYGIAVDSNGVIYTADLVNANTPTGPNYVIRKIGPAGQRNFPTTMVGKSSPVLTVLLTNTGNDDLMVSNQILGGSFPGDWLPDPATTSCAWTMSLAPGESCQLGFSFVPKASGPRPATVTFVDNTATFQNILYLNGYALAAPTTTTATVNPPIGGKQYLVGTTIPALVTVSNSITFVPTPPSGAVTLILTNTATQGVVNYGPYSLNPVQGTSSSTVNNQQQFNGLAVGNYSLVASYSGDALNAATKSAPLTFSVAQVKPTVAITNPAKGSLLFPGDTPVTLSVSNAGSALNPASSPSGTVTLTATGCSSSPTVVTATLQTGTQNVSTASTVLPAQLVGNCSLTATYNGDTADAVASTSSPDTFTLQKLYPKYLITSPAINQKFVPGNIPVSLSLSNAGLAIVPPSSPTGTVTLTLTNVTAATSSTSNVSLAPGPNGLSTLAIGLAGLGVGSYTLSGAYPGDAYDNAANFNAIAFTVAKLTPTVQIMSPTGSNVSYGTSLSLTARVSNANLTPAAPTGPSGTVTFTVTNNTTKAVSTYGPVALTVGSNGVSPTSATLTASGLKAGGYAIVATYNGDSVNNSAASPTLGQLITQVTPVINWPTPAYIYVGTKLSSTQLDATANALNAVVPGTYVYSPPAGTMESTPGTVTLNVTFTPTDATDFTTAKGSVQLQVRTQVTIKKPVRVALVPEKNPVQSGGIVRMAAEVKPVSGSAFPAGTVTLSESGRTLATAELSSGVARLVLHGLAKGNHEITATYSGDRLDNEADSLPVHLLVVTNAVEPVATEN